MEARAARTGGSLACSPEEGGLAGGAGVSIG